MTSSIGNENFLLQEIINGDSLSFRKIYEAYYMQVFLFATRLMKSDNSAEDIVQQAFIKIWETRDRIDISKNFKSYLFTITRNLIIDALKKISHDKSLIEKMFINMKAFEENSFSLLLQKEISRLHQEAINNLPRQRKIVYKLSREGELNYEEIASLLGISKNTVRNQISDASKSVRDYVRKHSDIANAIIFII